LFFFHPTLSLEGSKRRSLRPYTHAVIGYFDGELVARTNRAHHVANRAKELGWSTRNWNGCKRGAAAKAGEIYVNHNGCRVAARQAIIDIDTEFMTKYPTLEAYIAHEEAEFEAQCAAYIAHGNDKMVVLRWSSSLKNASKGLSEFSNHYSGLRVVPCVPVA
jgi:hypothetical protein